MKKFDLIYEKLLKAVNERAYVDSTFFDNINLLVRVLQENDYVSADKDAEEYAKTIYNQEDNVKKIILDSTEQSIPPIKLHITQDSDSESFSVTVFDLNSPKDRKEFKNTMLETIFDDVTDYIKQLILKQLEAPPVDEMPKEEGPNAQPGGGESALPDPNVSQEEQQPPPAA